ncbi:hypothetical protein [Dyadobacter jejuensis]|uniref:hypothetical protein n=1 Tax=Dyadobacter jejuensis TaxID=1082580 RepID=UPI001E2B9E54|nr:hypothetical protein [Dyadobacter jejuensis]
MKLVACCVALSLFLAFPPYTLLLDHFSASGAKLDAWLFIHNQAQDLLHPADYTLGVRREAMVFRWVLPALYYLTGGKLLVILGVQFALAVGFIYLLGRFCYQLFQNKVLTALVLLAVSNIFVSVWSFADVHGYGDGIAYFFILLALTSQKKWVVGLAMLVAYFTDERAVVAGGYVLIFWAIIQADRDGKADFWSILKSMFTGRSLMVWLAWVLYLSIRMYVKYTYFQAHHYSAVGLPVMFENQHRNGIGSSLWTAFEGTWLLLLAGALILKLQKRNWLLLLFVLGFLVLITTGIYVHDIDRAFGYGFPFILLSVAILKRHTSTPVLTLLLFIAMVLCVLEPQVFTMGYNKIVWLEPLPVKGLMVLSRYFGWGIFM